MVAAAPTVPAWRNAWMQLGPGSTEEERLTVYQAIRRSGSLPEEAGFYLVAWQADALTSLRAETELCELDERLEEVEDAYGRDEDGRWPAGGALVDPGFSLDLLLLQSLFAEVDDLGWNTYGYHGTESPFVSVEGLYAGRAVFLRVLSAAPEDEEPGMKFRIRG